MYSRTIFQVNLYSVIPDLMSERRRSILAEGMTNLVCESSFTFYFALRDSLRYAGHQGDMETLNQYPLD